MSNQADPQTPVAAGAGYLEDARQGRRDFLFIFGVMLAAVCLLASIVAWGIAARAESEAKSARATGSGQLAAGTANPTPMVHLSEYQINPGVIHASVGDKLQVMNIGSMTHNLAVDATSLATPMINPGGAAELALTGISAGTYTVYCQVPGHRDAGMHAQLIVSAGSSQTASRGCWPGVRSRVPGPHANGMSR